MEPEFMTKGLAMLVTIFLQLQLYSHAQYIMEDTSLPLSADPFAAAPSVGKPLGIFTGNLVSFPSEYRAGRPRLIDVWHSSLRFTADTDCSRLRVMDAILTILFNWDPMFLHAFYTPLGNESWIVTFNRFSRGQERFDFTPSLQLSLYEKEIRDDGATRRHKDPYVRVTYKYQSGSSPTLDFNNWDFHWSSVTEEDKGSSIVIPGSHPEEAAEEYRDRCLACYLLLTRPWEEKPGVEFICSSESKDAKQKRIFGRCHHVLSHWVYTGPKRAVGMNDKGYSSKFDV
ncbi:MAG: hypothetical protein Q9191_005849 [Dirinaria sp. TL-2023a]